MLDNKSIIAVQIEPIGSAGAEGLAFLHAACFENSWPRQSFESLLSLPTTRAFIAKAAGSAPCGFVLLSVVPPDAELITIGTVPAFRNQSVARQLLQHVIDQLKECDVASVFLEVRGANDAAQRLYRKAGFQQIGLRKEYYKVNEDHEDALVFQLGLS